MKNIILIFVAFLAVSCAKEEQPPLTDGNVLMLKVDYLTKTFEGGYEFSFEDAPNKFTVSKEYKAPGDFGYIKLFYDEIGEMLFSGTIVWSGCGQIDYPENILPASAFTFDIAIRQNLIIPNGFENIMEEFQPENETYNDVWASVQNLSKVREYITENPKQKVKIFLYTPSVGMGNPADWDWILFLKK